MSNETPAAAAMPCTMPSLAIPPARLRRPANLAALTFTSTAECPPIDGFTGQNRALDAVRFGSRIGKPGFNLFAIGAPGARMQHAVETMLTAASTTRPAPSDWVYVHNFAAPHRPTAIGLPAGRAPLFQKAMHELIEDLKAALPMAFESEDYQKRRGALDEVFQKKQADAFAALRGKAEAAQLVLLRTPLGFAFAPAKKGQVISPDEFRTWDGAKQAEVQKSIEALEPELEHIMHQFPAWEKARRDDVRKLNRDTAGLAIAPLIEDAKAKFADLPQVAAHLDTVRADLVENIGMFIVKPDGEEGPASTMGLGGPFDRYEVNVMVSHASGTTGAPVVQELHPTLGNLTGRIEYMSQQGALLTNFLLIKPGAIHRANGGYLLLDARSLLMEAFSWTALKRLLKQGKIVIEDVNHFLGLTSTVTLEPDPIPLDLKVILFGDRMLYYMLAMYDPEMTEHFKVLADFEDDFDRSDANEMALASIIASIAKEDKLRPLELEAVGLVIERAARMAEHSDKLSLLTGELRDLIVEADFRAGDAGHAIISRADVQLALDEQTRRAARLRDRSQEAILQEIALIDTQGSRTGQINGLSVLELGGFAFGRPSRITCRVRPGSGHVLDIEREAKLGGPIHSKGVLILSGFLAGRFALDTPMSLYASLVLEQSYGGVEGDSASSAELYALLSALAEAPLRQDIAVTGSINQQGEIQAIGGANEKIEGFFDICSKRGLTGTQGVAIPKSNVQHLMLRPDVVEACAQGRFTIYGIGTADEGIALLTGQPAGERGADGSFPPGSINAKVEARLRAFASIRQHFGDSKPPAPALPAPEPTPAPNPAPTP
jgi:predicted ATP-dependent protease